MGIQNFQSDSSKMRQFLNGSDQFVRKTKKSVFIGRVALTLSIITLFLLNIFIIYYSLYKNHEIDQLRYEINALKREIDDLQYMDGDDYLDEMKEYERQDYDDTDLDSEDYDSPHNNSDYDSSPDYGVSLAEILTKWREESKNRSRDKREVLSSTIDGVPIIAESYADRKKNKSLHTSSDSLRLYETLGGKSTQHFHNPSTRRYPGWTPRTYVHHVRHHHGLDGIAPTPMMSRTSRVMYTNEDKSKTFRKTGKKPQLKSSSSEQFLEQVQGPEMTIRPVGHRRRKHGASSNLETMDEKHIRASRTMSAVHYTGNASRYEHMRHPHYEGNGRLTHPEGLYVDWHPSPWVKTLAMDRIFPMHDGVLTVKEAGLYFIYAQIYYLDRHDKNGYRIYKNDEYLAQCTITAHSTTSITKANTCYTSTVDYLNEGDKIKIKDIEKLRYAYFDHGSSFFGLVKLGFPRATK